MSPILKFPRLALVWLAFCAWPGCASAAAAADLVWPLCDAGRAIRMPEKELPLKAGDKTKEWSVWWSDRAMKIYLDFGAPIYAAGEGTVLAAERRGPFGLMIDLKHAGVFTRYGHLQSILVRAGDRVKQGQKIATVGSSGRSASPGLYFAVHNNETLLDPKDATRRNPCDGAGENSVRSAEPTLRGTDVQ